MRLRAALAACVALVAAVIGVAPAAAHVVPQPAYLAPGESTTITFAAPNERPPHTMTDLTITAPKGVELTRTAPPPGWRLSTFDHTASWSKAAVTTGVQPSVPFRIVASTSLAPGAVAFHAAQRYDDGGVVRWTVAFTILPAAAPTPHQHLLPAIVTGILGLVVIGLLLFRMRGRHQPDLREE